MRLLFASALLVVTACATVTVTPKTCRDRADEQYRLCQNPIFRPQGDSESEMMATSDEQQACQESYQQALAACSPPPSVVTTSSTSAIPTVEE